MVGYVATNAASSGVKIDKKRLKQLARRSDRPGLIYLGQWIFLLICTGSLVWLTLGTGWVWPAMLFHGVVLTVPAYALSHETAHGTAFKTRWLNETVLWITSFLYCEEPLHRRYTHTSHHTYTWHIGKDCQMPFDTPMTFGGWLAECSGLALLKFHLTSLLSLALKRPSEMVIQATPVEEMYKLVRNARLFLALWIIILGSVFLGQIWLIWFFILPRLLGAPVMLLFTLIQHVELEENTPSIPASTRSFRTNWIGRFLYANMNNHVEHHLYPQVPFYALRDLREEISDQVPTPDPGFWRTNFEIISVVIRRSLGRNTKAASIRQAPHMVTNGGFNRIAERTM